MTDNNPAGQAPQAADPDKRPENDSNELIATRRHQLKKDQARIAGQLPEGSNDIWGLALSGGGIRSATFSLGLLRGLAKKKLLNRFDVLSMVSGGGYIGSLLGRLYDRERPDAQQIAKASTAPGATASAPSAKPSASAAADRVEDAMANAENTWFGWWLRSNGRYLAPAGFSDRLFAITLYLRSLLALHFEFGLLAVLAGCVLAALDLGAWQILAAAGFQPDTPELFHWLLFLKQWLPTAWLLLTVILPIALHLVFTYWDTQWVGRRFAGYCLGKAVICVILLAAAAKVGALAPPPVARSDTVTLANLLPGVAALVVLLLTTSAIHAGLGWLYMVGKNAKLVARGEPEKDALSEMRNQLTRQLMWFVGLTLLVLALGIAERLAWLLAFQTQVFETLDLGILLAVVSGVAQALMLSLRSAKGRTQQPDNPANRIVPHLLQLTGYLLAAALFVWWVSLVLKISFEPVFPILIKSDGTVVDVILPLFDKGWQALACIFVPTALYVAATGSNLGFLNLSSLHTFYKARLVRSYLGATNNWRFSGAGANSPLATIEAHELTTSKVRNVGKVAPGDDVALADYQPHLAGGPVHIINTCVNQTADPKGRLFNQDRKGLLLSVRAGGDSRLSQEGWRSEFQGIGKLSVGGWMAISGAAAAPGLGARTQRGLAALLTFAGVRLGYWLSRDERGGPDARCSLPGRVLAGMTSKSKALLRELSATFGAGPKDNWYISDGGFFENTGVYPLLLERARVIVLADCGADPGYSFEDVENLVRKARIDLNITITFRQPVALATLEWAIAEAPAEEWCPSLSYFGSLQDLAKDDNESCLALATVHYPDDTPDSKPAILILVKPNTFRSVSMDVANYKRQNPLFPQEPTGDQFFSESQWESYFSLGTDLGELLCDTLIGQLRTHLDSLFEERSAAAPSLPEAGDTTTLGKPVVARVSRSVWGRQVGAVGATLGAGAVLSLGVAAWQSFESYRTALSSRTTGERTALLEISKLWEKLPPGTPSADPEGAANRLAVALLRAGDSYCMKGEAGWLMNSDFGMRVIADAANSCAALKADMGRACQVLVEARTGLVSMSAGACLVKTSSPSPAVYWGYDYSASGAWNTLHPCSTQRETLVEQYENLSESYSINARDARKRNELEGLQEACSKPAKSQPPATRAPASVNPEPQPLPRELDNPVCKGNTIYMQIYGPEMRDQVRAFRPWWHTNWHASVPPIEDVVATAFRAARPAPKEVQKTTLRYHDNQGKSCADAIVDAVNTEVSGADWKSEPLSPAFVGAKGVIEVWFSKGDKVSEALFKSGAEANGKSP
ncbi:patatin-like phospholipase family protein [Pseudomonas sp. B2M1-30]|uniref:patatin-like phospholipase family protein n=1 Tax=Pseudomonas TaxID=286 RepID=UPI0021C7DA0D|nr:MULTISPECIES: patatin-like phospholipase family protein [Pseudomonas]MCU0117850.1 patatin-like phospholipase family protein [Pseudomonas sp. B2M1-30]MCU7259386.1 patatin-like phospholipase family protein [Pseudomonas koreensis]